MPQFRWANCDRQLAKQMSHLHLRWSLGCHWPCPISIIGQPLQPHKHGKSLLSVQFRFCISNIIRLLCDPRQRKCNKCRAPKFYLIGNRIRVSVRERLVGYYTSDGNVIRVSHSHISFYRPHGINSNLMINHVQLGPVVWVGCISISWLFSTEIICVIHFPPQKRMLWGKCGYPIIFAYIPNSKANPLMDIIVVYLIYHETQFIRLCHHCLYVPFYLPFGINWKMK